MTNFIPIFPLKMVAFPGENLNLHIFEPRYIQLINECFIQQTPLGLPSVINNEIKDFGTLIHVKEISKTYATGAMDIKASGGMIFRILEQIHNIPEKLYSGAIVNYPENHLIGNPEKMAILIQKMKNFHADIQVEKKFSKPDASLNTYDIAHHIGLTLPQEYEFLQLMQEQQRQTYLKIHLDTVLPAFEEIGRLKEKIKLNGHYRNIEGL